MFVKGSEPFRLTLTFSFTIGTGSRSNVLVFTVKYTFLRVPEIQIIVKAPVAELSQAVACTQACGAGVDDDDLWFVDCYFHDGHLAHDPCVGW